MVDYGNNYARVIHLNWLVELQKEHPDEDIKNAVEFVRGCQIKHC